jgi:hypothetical protein
MNADLPNLPPKTRVLILGGGFGGLYAALHLDKTIACDPDIEVTLAFSLDRLRNLTMDEINERYETFKLMSQFEVPET